LTLKFVSSSDFTMSLSRFYLPVQEWPSACVTGDEAKHCVQVLRRGVGDKIAIFDGAGGSATVEIVSASSKRVEFKVLETANTPPPAVTIELVQSVPKGANMELIIEKAVELGVNAIHPVLTERTVVKLDAKEAAKKQEKWQRIALEACKQCGQNWLPTVHAPLSLKECLQRLPAFDLKLVAALQDDARPLKAILHELQASSLTPLQSASIAIGPEGDFSVLEYETLRNAGFLPMSLGSIILRVETATMFSLSILSHELRAENDAKNNA